MHSIRENYKELINYNKLILKSQLKSTGEKRNVFTEAAINISLSASATINRINRNICLCEKQRPSMLREKKINVTI